MNAYTVDTHLALKLRGVFLLLYFYQRPLPIHSSWRLPHKRNTIYTAILTWKRVINALYSNGSSKIIESGLPRTVIIRFFLFCIWGQSLNISTQGIKYTGTMYEIFRYSFWRRLIFSVFETHMSGIIFIPGVLWDVALNYIWDCFGDNFDPANKKGWRPHSMVQ